MEREIDLLIAKLYEAGNEVKEHAAKLRATKKKLKKLQSKIDYLVGKSNALKKQLKKQKKSYKNFKADLIFKARNLMEIAEKGMDEDESNAGNELQLVKIKKKTVCIIIFHYRNYYMALNHCLKF